MIQLEVENPTGRRGFGSFAGETAALSTCGVSEIRTPPSRGIFYQARHLRVLVSTCSLDNRLRGIARKKEEKNCVPVVYWYKVVECSFFGDFTETPTIPP